MHVCTYARVYVCTCACGARGRHGGHNEAEQQHEPTRAVEGHRVAAEFVQSATDGGSDHDADPPSRLRPPHGRADLIIGDAAHQKADGRHLRKPRRHALDAPKADADDDKRAGRRGAISKREGKRCGRLHAEGNSQDAQTAETFTQHRCNGCGEESRQTVEAEKHTGDSG